MGGRLVSWFRRGQALRNIVAVAALACLAPSLAEGAECTGSCPTSGVCGFGCTEVGIRLAVVSANACTGPVTIFFDQSLCTATCGGSTRTSCCGPGEGQCTGRDTCYIDLQQSTPIGACSDDPPNEKSLCLEGDNITMSGEFKLMLQYAGARASAANVVAQPCKEDVPPGNLNVKGIRVRGNNNTIEALGLRYFPDSAIRVDTGNSHTLRYINADRICDDAIDTPVRRSSDPVGTPPGPTNLYITLSRLEGHTLADYTANGFYCLDNMNQPAPCGRGKGIQINSGTATVTNNDINRVFIPARVCSRGSIGNGGCGTDLLAHGPHVFSYNRTTGLMQV